MGPDEPTPRRAPNNADFSVVETHFSLGSIAAVGRPFWAGGSSFDCEITLTGAYFPILPLRLRAARLASLLAPIAALRDVMRRTSNDNAGKASHRCRMA